MTTTRKLRVYAEAPEPDETGRSPECNLGCRHFRAQSNAAHQPPLCMLSNEQSRLLYQGKWTCITLAVESPFHVRYLIVRESPAEMLERIALDRAQEGGAR